jgi:phosphoglycolate phosphatase
VKFGSAALFGPLTRAASTLVGRTGVDHPEKRNETDARWPDRSPRSPSGGSLGGRYPPRVLDAVLFDLDGTLTNPAAGICSSIHGALVEHRLPAPAPTELTWCIGPAIRDSMDRLGVPAEQVEGVVASYRARLLAEGLYQLEAIEGMPEVVQALANDGIPLALASAKMISMGRLTLEHLGLAEQFAVVAGGLEDGLTRSKAQIVADALAALGSPDPARVAMVGDRHHDLEGAKANGCLAVAVTWGFAEPGELDQHQPDHVVSSPAELRTLLAGLRRAR